MPTRRLVLLALLTVAILGVAGSALAQGVGGSPHPTMPWSYPRPDPGPGAAVRYIVVPPQALTLDVAVDVPAGVPPEHQPQVIEVPGYVMTETTNGYVIPDRWSVRQVGAGMFQWQRLPAEFRRK